METKKIKKALIKITMDRSYTGTMYEIGYKFLCWDNEDEKTQGIIEKAHNDGFKVVRIEIPVDTK